MWSSGESDADWLKNSIFSDDKTGAQPNAIGQT